jgi:hypothetical protein
MRLTIAQAVGLVADAAFARRPPATGFLPRIDPRLRVAYCPRLHSPPPDRFSGEKWDFWGRNARLSGPWQCHGSAGLVGCAESVQRDCPPRRYGLNGLTATGRRRLTAGCCLLEERRRLLSFWTITLPDEVMAQLLELDSWPRFQNAIRHRLVRRLEQRGLEPLVLAVAELHPGRSLAAGQALPHLHVLFQGKARGASSWALHTAELDALIVVALEAAGVSVDSLPSAGNVQAIRKSVRRYLSKYVSKSSHVFEGVGCLAMIGDPRLCPRQWWFMSRSLLAMIEAATRCLPAEFLAWMIDRSNPGWKGAPYVVQRVPIPDPTAPTVWTVTFRSPWALFLTWEAFEKAAILGERDPRCFRRHDRSQPLQHPQRHQHL